MMDNNENISPVLIICLAIMLLSGLCGALVERAIGKENRLWIIASSPALLAGVVIGIDMIVTRRALFRNRELTGKSAVVVGVITVILFGLVFICLISNY